ncbi:MAG: 1,4-alpha-glucan branching protein domain-containing protein [Spirochaetota bacterium]
MSYAGYQILLLHAHLPYIRHKGYSVPFLEENWLNEAICDTYLPLIRVFRKLRAENIPFKITMSFTPTLLSMLDDSYLQENFIKYIESLIQLSLKEVKRNVDNERLAPLSSLYLENYEDLRSLYFDLNKNIISGFSEFVQSNNLEILASCATHAFLPLLESEPSSIRAQLKIGKKVYKKFWGLEPRGLWLPECGYFNGLETYLTQEGFKYFFVDSHGILHASPRPKYGVYAPVEVGSNLFAFGRDPLSSKQVWSATEGYPGDYRYREYYRDIGFDLDMEYIKDFIHPGGIRRNTGIKYYRITGENERKELYNPREASEALDSHVEHFVNSRIQQSERIIRTEGQPAVIVSPYDAELFGHWWHEGPSFIEKLCKKIYSSSQKIHMVLPMQSLGLLTRIQPVNMNMSSWGESGYSDVWINQSNDWIYRHIMECSILMNEKVHEYKHETDPIKCRLLNQMGRELLLLQSSDWAFIMKADTMVEYAVKRTRIHTTLFLELNRMLSSQNINEERLVEIENEHPIFPELKFGDFL